MLGLQISKDSLRNVLLVRQLLPVGAVCDWNEAHPSDKIEIGCIIVAVDGVAGDASLMSDACVQSSKSSEAKVIRMKIIKINDGPQSDCSTAQRSQSQELGQKEHLNIFSNMLSAEPLHAWSRSWPLPAPFTLRQPDLATFKAPPSVGMCGVPSNSPTFVHVKSLLLLRWLFDGKFQCGNSSVA